MTGGHSEHAVRRGILSGVVLGCLLFTVWLLSGCSQPQDIAEPVAPDSPRAAMGDVNPVDPERDIGEGEPEGTAAEALNSGRWRPLRTAGPDAALTAEQRAQIAQLEAIGYLAGSAPARESRGVTRHDASPAFRGLNFYTSGHAPVAVLTDMAGTVLHTWRKAFREVWPNYPVKDSHFGIPYWRRACLFENGDVLAIFEGLGIIKVDKDSRLVWANPCHAHHDIEVIDNGDIYVLGREAHVVDFVDMKRPILEDYVVVLDAEGNEKKRVSVLQALEYSRFRGLRPAAPGGNGDIFHTNTLEVLNGAAAQRNPVFRAGNVLLSLLMLDAIAVLDMEQERIVWAKRGTFRRQHDPQILANGNLLLFDNRGLPMRSRILEFDPADMSLVWSYAGTEAEPFYSHACGVCQRLPNGNTLITETDNGRAFEVTQDGEVVWEFHNPERAGEDQEYIAALFEVNRLPADFPIAWTARGNSSPEESTVRGQ